MIMNVACRFRMTGKKESMINETETIEKHFGNVASLIGEKSRAIMLWSLLDGKAYTATELAICADISAQAASNHLSKLLNANLLSVTIQGRHKYYRFANDKIAHTIEMIAGILPMETTRQKNNQPVSGIKYARTCYDHIAGKAGVLITNALLQKEIIIYKKDVYEVSAAGKKWFDAIGIDVDDVQQTKRKFAFPCLDWSERKHHLAGALGSAFLNAIVTNDWIRKIKHSREIIITAGGKKELNKRLNIDL